MIAWGWLIGFKAICIVLVAEVFVFPILQSPHDVALFFRTCQLHTAGEFLHDNGGSERQQPGMGTALLHCTGSADNTQDNTKQEDLLIQEYSERGIQNKSEVKRQRYPAKT